MGSKRDAFSGCRLRDEHCIPLTGSSARSRVFTDPSVDRTKGCENERLTVISGNDREGKTEGEERMP